MRKEIMGIYVTPSGTLYRNPSEAIRDPVVSQRMQEASNIMTTEQPSKSDEERVRLMLTPFTEADGCIDLDSWQVKKLDAAVLALLRDVRKEENKACAKIADDAFISGSEPAAYVVSVKIRARLTAQDAVET